ncbi:bifunctional adenosylcobinamide kinase/adenosylcobinamide-phosphate guanylyltransferase [Ureibacillus aquaedulcis]|uniref:Adenosylcobinamide kinase n=1 Tax=Ureibacillus aquaedulcis TaxID=3058421 RepID=A0ABT8GPU6_9BACL|nr:bifunctional adenosylcobinamide kinase/adenosylcobinamide-phosphate guanylyltransferase [Ureibacillus sp. BA0131]MDN4493259.1 bifunctional adenosylcobinamide kinase/adenosylcobinamide-phosphate guanylyltransferase [Ureibacillus sp. BA0131]
MCKLVFITGGVRSGKSAFAECYAKQLHQQFERTYLYYIASGVAMDEEMSTRIKRHQEDRQGSAVVWNTIEIQADLGPAEAISPKQSVILWDCITTWLSNVLYKTEELDENGRMVEIEKYLGKLKKQLIQWTKDGGIVLLVSNEILDEPNSSYSEVNVYRQLLGELHQWIAHYSDEAYEMDYSKVKRWK